MIICMKKLIFITILTIYSISINAQLDINYGIKTGLNYNSYGSFSIYFYEPSINPSRIAQSERDFGFHVGMYAQLNITKLYIRPELLFSKNKSTYNYLVLGDVSHTTEFKLSMYEIPVLVGFRVIKPISLYIGPTFQFIIDYDYQKKIDNQNPYNLDLNLENDFVLGLNVGVSLQLQKFGFDLRYSWGLSENLAVDFSRIPADGWGYSIDTKSNQIIFSFSYQINKI